MSIVLTSNYPHNADIALLELFLTYINCWEVQSWVTTVDTVWENIYFNYRNKYGCNDVTSSYIISDIRIICDDYFQIDKKNIKNCVETTLRRRCNFYDTELTALRICDYEYKDCFIVSNYMIIELSWLRYFYCRLKR